MFNLHFLRIFIVLIFITFIPTRSWSTHLMGGELTYIFDGSDGFGSYYIVKLNVYRYCDTTNGSTAALDYEMFLGLFVDDPADPTGPKVWYGTETLLLLGSEFVTYNSTNPNCTFNSSACIERGEYDVVIYVPDNPGGYHLAVERCCRNGNIVNLDAPGAAGMTFYAYIPPGMENSSPQISDVSVPFVCIGDTTSLINNAFDPDGDSLAYDFVIPFNGYSNQLNPAPDPIINSPYALPIPEIVYAPTYSPNAFLGPGGYHDIDPVSGLTRYYFPNQGFYVAAIEIREYRNGVLISSIRRDIQFISIVCDPNSLPTFNPSSNGAVYTIPEGQTLCFNVSFTDADGDSLFMEAEGPLLDPAVVNPAGVITNASGDNSVSSQFCWTPVCGMARPSPYQFSVSVTDNGCPAKTTNQVFSVYVTTGPGSLMPSVAVSQSSPGAICSGSAASFIANPTLQGNNPHYQWSVNGIVAGTDSVGFNAGVLNNGDIVKVRMVTDAQCVLEDTVLSPPYVVNVLAQPAPTVNITSNPALVLCPQQICLFTANVTNGGGAPNYQWYINGAPGGTNFHSFTAASPAGNMSVYVQVTPSTGCPPEISNTIEFEIVPDLHPVVTMSASYTDSICPGQEVIFVASASNTGNPPIFNWRKNGTSVGVANDTLILTNIQEGDVINVSVTSTYQCLSPDIVYATPLTYHIYPQVVNDVTDGPFEVCLGSPLQLNMMVTGGDNKTYQYHWSAGNSTSSAVTFVPVVSGYYYGTASDRCYTAVTDSVYVQVLPVPESIFSWDPKVPDTFYPQVRFTDHSVDAVAWEWKIDSVTTPAQHPEFIFTKGGIHPIRLVTTNTVGCTDTLIQFLEYNNIITNYIPNSFTPNGDGLNDKFGMDGFATGGYTMSIFSRWGEEIFFSDGYNQWNGEDRKGNAAPVGTYVYLVTIKNDKKSKPYYGTVNLVR